MNRTRRHGWSLAATGGLFFSTLLGCGETPRDGARPESLSPSARPEIVDALRQDIEVQKHPADGGGRARFAAPAPPARAGISGTWTIDFEVGDRGIAENGWVFLQAPPFWGWSTPQVLVEDAPGFTTVEIEDASVRLESATVDQQLLGVQVVGRGLRAGERIRFVYGAGPAGATADRFAETESCFHLAVDGDGDGIRALIPDRLCVEVLPGEAAALVAALPSVAAVGESTGLRIAVVDSAGNHVRDWRGRIDLEAVPEVELPRSIQIRREDGGSARVEVAPTRAGIFTVVARSADGLAAETNPIVVGAELSKVFWADLHGHSALSDGTGTPKDYFRFARDVAALDVVALTDHDHWGLQPLAQHPELWEEIRRETELFHRPGEFVTLLGYEWTSWLHGHRHVLYFEDRGDILSSVDPRFESPQQLWDGLRGRAVLTFAHHSAGGPIATNWDFPPDPELEPVTEVVSTHGSSEAEDSPGRIYNAVSGNFVRDVLQRGFRLGFVGSGDGHDGHPGLAQLAGGMGGLAAILATENTRKAILEALRARRVYATNGPRIVLVASLNGHSMGAVIDPREQGSTFALEVEAVGTNAVDRIDVIASSGVIDRIDCEGLRRCQAERLLDASAVGSFLYVRVIQADGGAAWSSPFYVSGST